MSRKHKPATWWTDHEEEHWDGYGLKGAQRLADLDEGDVVSLLNADNYACFVATLGVKLWNEEDATRS